MYLCLKSYPTDWMGLHINILFILIASEEFHLLFVPLNINLRMSDSTFSHFLFHRFNYHTLVLCTKIWVSNNIRLYHLPCCFSDAHDSRSHRVWRNGPFRLPLHWRTLRWKPIRCDDTFCRSHLVFLSTIKVLVLHLLFPSKHLLRII